MGSPASFAIEVNRCTPSEPSLPSKSSAEDLFLTWFRRYLLLLWKEDNHIPLFEWRIAKDLFCLPHFFHSSRTSCWRSCPDHVYRSLLLRYIKMKCELSFMSTSVHSSFLIDNTPIYLISSFRSQLSGRVKKYQNSVYSGDNVVAKGAYSPCHISFLAFVLFWLCSCGYSLCGPNWLCRLRGILFFETQRCWIHSVYYLRGFG